MLIGFCFCKCCFQKERWDLSTLGRIRKIEVPTDTPTEFELGDTAADIQKRREEREKREGEEDSQKQQREEREREEARWEETTHSTEEQAIVDFVKDYEEATTRSTILLRTRLGRNACGRGSTEVASCLSKCASLGLNPKGLTKSFSPCLASSKGNDREAELDSE